MSNETILNTEQKEEVKEVNSTPEQVKEESKEVDTNGIKELELKLQQLQQENKLLKEQYESSQKLTKTQEAKNKLLEAGAKSDSLDYLITKYGTDFKIAEITQKENFLFQPKEVVVEKPKKLTAAEIKRMITGKRI